jgi:hypothetical protein
METLLKLYYSSQLITADVILSLKKKSLCGSNSSLGVDFINAKDLFYDKV